MHISFLSLNFLAPTQKPAFWAPQKPHVSGNTARSDPRKLFGEILFWCKNREGDLKYAMFGHTTSSLGAFSRP